MTRAEYEAKYGVPAPDVATGTPFRAPIPTRQAQEGVNVLGSVFNAVVKDPINTLLVTPADRFAEAVGRTGVLGGDIKRGYEAMADAGEKRSYLGIDVDAQKAFGKGGAGQITGQALKSASYLAGGALAPKVVLPPASTFVAGALRGAGQGALAGGVTGLLGGSGEALYKGGTLGEATKKGLEGGVAGAVTGGVLGAVIGGTAGKLHGIHERRQELKSIIESGQNTGKDFAKIKLANGQVVSDPRGIQAVNSGIDQKNVAVIKAMDSKDREAAKKMIELAKRAMDDKTIIDRPADIVGENFLKPVRALGELNKGFGSQLDDVALSLKGQPVSAKPALSAFTEKLLKEGATFADDGTIQLSESTFRTNPKAMGLLEKAYKEVANTADDGLALHRTKKALDELVEFGKSSDGALGNAERIVKGLRKSVDSVLDAKFPAYNKINTDWSATKDALDEVGDILGSKFDIKSGKFADIRAGSVMRRILGEGAGRGDILQTIQAVEEIAKKYNVPLEGSTVKQIIFADTLSDIYGTQATTGLQGAVERAVGRVKGGDVNFKQMAVDTVRGALDNVQGRTVKGQEQAILALLDDSFDDVSKINPLQNVTKTVGKEVYALGAPQVAQDTAGGVLGNAVDTDDLRKANQVVVDQLDNERLLQQGLKDVPYADMDDNMRAVFFRDVVNAHANEAQDVLTNLPAENIQKLGGVPALLERVKINIVNGLAGEGADDLSKLASTVSTKGVKSIEELVAKMSALLK